jgi:DNA polymerase-3 subunit alpha
MVDDYIERRHGRKQVRYDFAPLKEVMGNTYGVPVYQEQIMAIFQVLAGYSLGEADLVRRAMGKKKREELDAHKEKFFVQAVERGHDKNKLEKLWNSLEGFADYAFNRSHSMAYGLLAYHTAYLKAHYPAHFWAAVLSNEINDIEKVARYIDKAKQMGMKILPPDINVSLDTFTPKKDTIRFGLAAIKGIGQATVTEIVAAREKSGDFKSIYDFAERVEAKALNKRVFENLIKSGAFDSIKKDMNVTEWRAKLFAAVDSAIESGIRMQRDRNSGQESLFGMFDEVSTQVLEPELPNAEPWSQMQMLTYEKETLGFYITGHPLEQYQSLMKEFSIVNLEQLKTFTANSNVKIAGIISSISIKATKKGDKFALCQLEDQFGAIKLTVWPEAYNKIGSRWKEEERLVISGRLDIDAESAMSIDTQDAQLLDGISERSARQIIVRVNAELMTEGKIEKLYHLLDSNRGDCEVIFELELPNHVVARVRPNSYATVKSDKELIDSIKTICGNCKIQLKR